MNPLPRRLLFWMPRVLTMVFATFLCLFALDVFSEGGGIREIALDLFMHLIPTFIIIGILIVSWRREWIGAILYIALAIVYIISSWGRFPLGNYFIIAGPLLVMGALFMANWLLRAKIHGDSMKG